MPDTYQEYKKGPYFPICANDDLQKEDDQDLSQIDQSDSESNGIAHDLPVLIISNNAGSYDNQELDSHHSTNVPERSNRVRFRSRVRITSGSNRHRRKSQQQQENQPGLDYLSFSQASSLSCSPSSSISVPLRTHTDEQVGKPGWGTLGQRVSLFAKERRKIREQRDRLGLGASFRQGVQRGGLGGGKAPAIPYVGTHEVNEETPLLLSLPNRHRRPASITSDRQRSNLPREDEASQMVPPGGLAWWWWQMEPIICCRYLTESDEES